MSCNNSIVVLKFGGTSVSNLHRWQQILKIIQQRLKQGFQVAIVHSAKSGITNYLEKFTQTGALDLIDSIAESMQELAQQLNVPADIERYIQQLITYSKQKTFSNHDIANILSFGELMTHHIALRYLSQHVDIVSLDPKVLFISQADDDRLESSRVLSAKCNIAQHKTSHQCVIMPGFIAADKHGHTIVLGRGGSDTSASYLAVSLAASRIEIWTDVHGIFSANPHILSSARLIEKIGYEEAREIAASGGKVLHPRCILPAEQNNIPIHIYNSKDMDADGTIIKKGYESSSPRVRAVNVRHKVTLVSMDSINMWHQAGFMGKIFTVYEKLGLSIDIVVTAQTNVTISLDTADNVINKEILQQLQAHLSLYCQVVIYKNCSAVTLVGYRMRALLGQIAPIISGFAEQRIYLTSQSSNDLNISIVVDEDQSDKLLIALHDDLITENANQYGLGATWQQLQDRLVEPVETPKNWWHIKRQQLLSIAQQHSPCYVYDESTIIRQIRLLKSLTNIDKIFFAMKSNANADVLRTIYAHGIGIETVSPGEIDRVENAIHAFSDEDILFTPNFAAIDEYQAALNKNFHVTIDNKFILQEYPQVFANKKLILRLDPGHGSGHHRYVRTAGEQSKFGIHHSELQEVKELCDQHNITIVGLHAHAGSGILEHQNWQRIIQYLTDQVSIFDAVTLINIGGGFGVTENPHDKGLDINKLDAIIGRFKNRYPKLQFWMEPGRFLVANAGALMAKVTQTKVKGSNGYIGLETGMNSLIRPALYGAWHNIVNLSRLDDNLDITATIVGPMCETGDIIGVDRKVPYSQAGDVYLIANCGAYGFSMSSNYNLRAPAQEIFLKAKK
ncbi:MAG TPA: bifunctional aspartate kinase/diaminopimelate decarboxylase [Oceanospirillales bacterium]|nr:bifunctional aspartate kinase/diaminopimelate decarboxylase [Oceanospirillales bacterium]